MISKKLIIYPFLLILLLSINAPFVKADNSTIDELTGQIRPRQRNTDESVPEVDKDKIEIWVDFNPQRLKGQVQSYSSAIRKSVGENRNQELWLVDQSGVDQLIQDLEADQSVENIIDSQLVNVRPFSLEDYFDDPYAQLQWNFEMTELDGLASFLKDQSSSFSPVTIIVVDDGIWSEHEDFGGIVSKRIKCSSIGCEEGDDYQAGIHGTHVAGVIGASINNEKGIVSANLKNKFNLVSIRVYDVLGRSSGIINSLDYIINNYSDQSNVIVNFSLGTCFDDPEFTEEERQETISFFREKYNQIWQAGILPIAAAGNTGAEADNSACFQINSKAYPAGFENVISVASLGPEGEKSSFSQYGSWVDVTAPGGDQEDCQSLLTDAEIDQWVNECNYGQVDSGSCDKLGQKVQEYQDCMIRRGILSLVPPNSTNGYRQNDYMSLNGTSMSAPLVSGLAGLVWSVDPSLTNQEVREVIFSTSEKIANTGDYWRYGQVNFNEAVRQALGEEATPTSEPTATVTSVPTGTATEVPTAISEPTNPPEATPTLPPFDQRCNNFCSKSSFSQGDADCDGQLDNQDYQIWLNQFERKVYQRERIDTLADFDCDGQVDLSDFELWRRNGTK